MRGLYRFLWSTMVGGIIVLVPLAVLGALLAWAAGIAYRAFLPMFEWLPDRSVGGVSLAALMSLGGVIGGCFLAGLFAETAALRWLTGHTDKLALFVPGYALMKHVGADFIGIERKQPVKAVAVRFEASWQLGFLMDLLPDGRNVVFIPEVPRALVGTLHLVAPDRVQVLSMSAAAALDIVGRLGIGCGTAWAHERAP